VSVSARRMARVTGAGLAGLGKGFDIAGVALKAGGAEKKCDLVRWARSS